MTDILKDLLTDLTSLPDKDKEDLAKHAIAATKGMRFIPTPGPQFDAYVSKADILLFGGSPGGGKTALEVGLALNEHRRALIVRKNFVDLAGVLHTLDNILGQEGSAVGGTRPVYRKPEGGVIDFMGMGDSLDGKQGNPHDLLCVGKGTPVLMADGSYRRVEEVKVGDFVQTLEGPRAVENTFGPFHKNAVLLSSETGSQIQSEIHEVLTPSGWLSACGPLPSEICEPMVCRIVRKSFEGFCRRFLALSKSRALRAKGLGPSTATPGAGHLMASEDLSAYVADTAGQDRESVCEEFDGNTRGIRPRALWSGLKLAHVLPRHATVFAMQILNRFGAWCGAFCARKTSLLRDCLGNYPGGSRSGGERTPVSSGPCVGPRAVRLYLHQPNGAGRSSPIDWLRDVLVGIPRYILHKPKYGHPYTKGVRQASEHVRSCSAWLSPVGECELYDLQVNEVNHYITRGGFINRNCIDEAAQIPENQFRMLLGWLRTDVPGQRCRVVLGSNPPLDTTGDWMIEFFAPWLDPKHPNPAAEGELRYYLPDESGMGYRECSPDEYIELNGVKVYPTSRTFIGSKFTDNPYYDPEQYAKSLANLPDSVRARLMSGNFLLDRPDGEWQTIPTSWVKEAQARWTTVPRAGIPMCAMGLDVAQGGDDNTCLAIRHDGWYAPLVVVPGKETPDGKTAAAEVLKRRRSNAKVIVDLGGGWGGDAYGHLKENGIDTVGYMGVKASTRRTNDASKLKFFNVRTEAYWRFREALDPSQEQGSPIMLPHDPVLVADLCAPTYEITPNGIKVESKEKVKERLGRSPDRGDAVVMAWWDGMRQSNVQGGWAGQARRTPQVIMRKR